MTFEQAKNKLASNNNVKTVGLANVTSGAGGDDFITGETVIKFTQDSLTGYADKTMPKAIYVLAQRCTVDDKNKVTETNDVVQVYLSMFDRVATPYREIVEDGVVTGVERDGEPIRAEGDVIKDWKAAANANAFIQACIAANKYIKFSVKAKVSVRKWDRKAEDWSTTELREQKVFNANYVG